MMQISADLAAMAEKYYEAQGVWPNTFIRANRVLRFFGHKKKNPMSHNYWQKLAAKDRRENPSAVSFPKPASRVTFK